MGLLQAVLPPIAFACRNSDLGGMGRGRCQGMDCRSDDQTCRSRTVRRRTLALDLVVVLVDVANID